MKFKLLEHTIYNKLNEAVSQNFYYVSDRPVVGKIRQGSEGGIHISNNLIINKALADIRQYETPYYYEVNIKPSALSNPLFMDLELGQWTSKIIAETLLNKNSNKKLVGHHKNFAIEDDDDSYFSDIIPTRNVHYKTNLSIEDVNALNFVIDTYNRHNVVYSFKLLSDWLKSKGYTCIEYANYLETGAGLHCYILFSPYDITQIRPKNVKSIKESINNAEVTTNKGTKIYRNKVFGVGKDMYTKIYAHKNYIKEIVPEDKLNQALNILNKLYPDFTYNGFSYDSKHNTIGFQEAPDFNTAEEPIVGKWVSINLDNNKVTTGTSNAVWHHKWLWVKDDYNGFDVNKSINRSKSYLAELPETTNGTTRNAWYNQLMKNGLDKYI